MAQRLSLSILIAILCTACAKDKKDKAGSSWVETPQLTVYAAEDYNGKPPESATMAALHVSSIFSCDELKDLGIRPLAMARIFPITANLRQKEGRSGWAEWEAYIDKKAGDHLFSISKWAAMDGTGELKTVSVQPYRICTYSRAGERVEDFVIHTEPGISQYSANKSLSNPYFHSPTYAGAYKKSEK